MRKIKVKVSNDSERNAVLKAWKKNGCKWAEGEALHDFAPKRDYPYYLFRDDNKKVMYGGVNNGKASFDYKEVPVDKFRKFMGEEPVITIYSDGKKVKAVRYDGEIGVARCSPEDEFDLSVGAKLAIDRMFEIEVGDKVEVKNSGATFDAYTDFFEQNKLPREMAARYMYRTVPCNGAVGNVVAIHKHESGYCDVAVVEGRNGDIYLLNVRGLKKV